MALSQAAALAEKIIGHKDNAETAQDITNPARDRKKYADPSGETMKALCWMGKNTVEISRFKISPLFSSPLNHKRSLLSGTPLLNCLKFFRITIVIIPKGYGN